MSKFLTETFAFIFLSDVQQLLFWLCILSTKLFRSLRNVIPEFMLVQVRFKIPELKSRRTQGIGVVRFARCGDRSPVRARSPPRQ